MCSEIDAKSCAVCSAKCSAPQKSDWVITKIRPDVR